MVGAVEEVVGEVEEDVLAVAEVEVDMIGRSISDLHPTQ